MTNSLNKMKSKLITVDLYSIEHSIDVVAFTDYVLPQKIKFIESLRRSRRLFNTRDIIDCCLNIIYDQQNEINNARDNND